MEFKYTGIFHVEEEDLARMRWKVKKGEDPYKVVHEWSYARDITDYHAIRNSYDLRTQIINFITDY